MKLETIRMIKAALADGTHGINAQLAALTLNGSDGRPANPTVYTDVDNNWVARRRIDDGDAASNITFPALAVFGLGTLRAMTPGQSTHVVLRDAELTIGLRYIVKKQASAEVVANGLYCNRALMRVANWLFSQNDPNGGVRTMNGVIIADILDFEQAEVTEDWNAADSIVGTDMKLWIRESLP